ncbi:unnamed protein product [Diplocarpon coronariae]|uniref:Uncharacterized protein n=1 Tax=Diplocarpon coronariae TaxID=2795749 RepID=A0A218YX42_9HELO|nr:hypothetical protein B2J93_730 [Marssonina coronariae]
MAEARFGGWVRSVDKTTKKPAVTSEGASRICTRAAIIATRTAPEPTTTDGDRLLIWRATPPSPRSKSRDSPFGVLTGAPGPPKKI